MSLVVKFQGQVKPYEMNSINESLRTKRMSRIAPVFDDVLAQAIEKRESHNKEKQQHHSENNSAIKKYQKSSKALTRRYFARDIMSENIITLTPENTLNDALSMMHAKKFHHIPVEQDKKVVGIVSDRLLISSLAQGKNLVTPLSEIMVQETICGTPNTTIGDIARCMLNEDISCLPITDDQFQLKGMVTKSDLLSLLMISFPLDIYS